MTRDTEARGFGDAIDPQVLAKVMLAERFLPTAVFDYIATSVATSADGRCTELQALEEQARGVKPIAAVNKSGGDTAPNSIVEDWSTRPELVRWANIDPKIGEISLQPYLFVINDVKNYMGSDAPLSPKLKALLERLSGGDVSAKGAAADLKHLDASEVDSLVRELRIHVLASSSFASRPDALIGLGEVVLAHRAFELRYIEVLEELPSAQLGIWAASAHSAYIGESSKTRFDALLTRWKKEGSPQLKKALETRASLPTGRR